tara:strand:- start:310 stop:726 length:417 start_codon:yes stop_codon:yes gene_type:complete
MANLKTTFKVKGPIFDSSTEIASKMTRVVNRGLLEMITIEGSNVVKKQLYVGHGRITADLRDHVGANIVKDLVGQVDAGEHRYGRNLIYSNWVEGISSKNASSVFKGYQMFENAYNNMDNKPDMYQKYILDPVVEAFD